MRTTSASEQQKPEQDFRFAVALELASLHAREAADSRLKAAFEKLRRARDEIASLKAEKRNLIKKIAAIEKAQKEREEPLTDEEKQRRIRQILGISPEYDPPGGEPRTHPA